MDKEKIVILFIKIILLESIIFYKKLLLNDSQRIWNFFQNIFLDRNHC